MNPSQLDLEKELELLHEDSFGWALNCTGWNEADAEDVLQATYLRVLTGKAQFSGRSAFRTWLFGVIRMVAMEQARRSARRSKLDVQAARQITLVTEVDPTQSIERSQSTAELIDAMDQLPERQREVLHLVFYQGLSVAEAAEAMGVSVGSARTHYARGKAAIRAALEGGES